MKLPQLCLTIVNKSVYGQAEVLFSFKPSID